MLEKSPLPDLAIINCLKTYYGIEATSLIHLLQGADTNATVYQAQTPDQMTYFIKLKQGHHHDTGVEITELLLSTEIQHIIPAIPTLQGKPTQPIEEYTLIVYPFVDGEDGFHRSLTDEQWIQLGKTLRQIHDLKVPQSTQARIRREDYSTKWREIVRSIYAHVNAEPTGDEIALKLQKFMKQNLLDIQRLVERAEQFGKALKKDAPKCVLCHSDIHAGNVLLNGNTVIYLVDWDDPIFAPKERDLMFIGGGVGNVWNQPSEEELFYMGYGKTKINLLALAYYRHERIVEDIAIYSQELLLKTAGSKERSEMYKHFIALFEPQGVVDIAFKTDLNLPP